ncbi:hypothetical protein P8452_17416 [Trifolium repens]|nr:hypothetical protein P8452_17416 [Trifolium repens]
MIPPLTAQFMTSSRCYRLYTHSIIYYEFRTNTKSKPDINSMGAPAYPARLREYVIKVHETWASSNIIVLRCRASYCDGRFSQDLFLLIAWRARSLHRGTIAHIVLRWNAVFLNFLGFFLSFCILDSVLMLFLAFVGFPSGNRVHCTLWDDFALRMQQYLDRHDPALPVIIIFQLCKLKKYLGFMGISNSFHGSKLFLNADLPDVTDYIERMNASNVELTQCVSQMTGPTLISTADDLLQTRRMTIKDLIEATEKCHGSVLAWTCEFATDAGWFYQACTKCSSRIGFIGGQLYCDKCRLPRTAIPKFKVHLEVIDNTGSITFILFDRVVTQVVGTTALDLLDSISDMGFNFSFLFDHDNFPYLLYWYSNFLICTSYRIAGIVHFDLS